MAQITGPFATPNTEAQLGAVLNDAGTLPNLTNSDDVWCSGDKAYPYKVRPLAMAQITVPLGSPFWPTALAQLIELPPSAGTGGSASTSPCPPGGVCQDTPYNRSLTISAQIMWPVRSAEAAQLIVEEGSNTRGGSSMLCAEAGDASTAAMTAAMRSDMLLISRVLSLVKLVQLSRMALSLSPWSVLQLSNMFSITSLQMLCGQGNAGSVSPSGAACDEPCGWGPGAPRTRCRVSLGPCADWPRCARAPCGSCSRGLR